jgi:aspartyl-tRNA(Asn)/glutamyl-tRNA(Gln) amidotransferase subunit B
VLLDVQMHQNACFLPATQKNRPSVSSPPVPSAPAAARTLANLLLNEVSAFLNAEGQAIATTRLTPQALAELARLLDEGTISSKQCKEVLNETFTSGEAPTAIVERLGIRQVSDVGELEAVVVQVLEEFSDKAAEYRGGKTGLLGFFVGQAMKATGGQANPRLLNELFTERLQ